MTKKPDFIAPASFDRALVDAPCSGLGVLRRNPEIRWRRTPGDIETMSRVQSIVLDQTAPLVRPGGHILYSVCTFTPQETEQVVEKFLACHPEFVRVDLRSLCPPAWQDLFDQWGQFRSWPHHHHGMDAFFAAGLKRRG
jgi:16S rRNA (cytosine967-C5)-methyltransferase